MTSEFDALVRSKHARTKSGRLDKFSSPFTVVFLVTALGYFCPYTMANYEIS